MSTNASSVSALLPDPAVLVLEDGTIHRGHVFGASGKTLGEAVFTTAMSGYQETLTDPSYCAQIVVAAAPQIGNTGWNFDDGESHLPNAKNNSGQIWVSGLAVRENSHRASNWRSEHTLEHELREQGIVGIANIDTRAVVRRLRDHGSMKAGIFSGSDLSSDDEMLAEVRSQPSMAGANLSAQVSVTEAYVVPAEGEKRFTVAAIDLGIKTNTPRSMAQRGIEVHVLPHNSSFDNVTALNPDGVFFSNGPGDPATADAAVALAKATIEHGIPLFGICFGNQILGRALGLDTYKMVFGHRGINVPVKELATGKIDITAQNHGFALRAPEGGRWDSPFGPASVTHVCANDDTVEGVALDNGMAFSVQYHPEAAAGPHDSARLFDQFVDLMAARSAKTATGKADQ